MTDLKFKASDIENPLYCRPSGKTLPNPAEHK